MTEFRHIYSKSWWIWWKAFKTLIWKGFPQHQSDGDGWWFWCSGPGCSITSITGNHGSLSGVCDPWNPLLETASSCKNWLNHSITDNFIISLLIIDYSVTIHLNNYYLYGYRPYPKKACDFVMPLLWHAPSCVFTDWAAYKARCKALHCSRNRG